MSNGHNGLREFCGFRIDLEKKVLWHSDEPVALPSKAVELLCVLVERQGEVVTKDEILSEVWKDSFVEESVLTQNVHHLRKTFKTLFPDGELIQTVPRRGYRFAERVHEFRPSVDLVLEHAIVERHLLAEVDQGTLASFDLANIESLPSGTQSAPIQRKVAFGALAVLVLAFSVYFVWRSFAPAAVVTLREVGSIAVLPIKQINGQGNETLSLGLTDSLISRLGKLNRFAVRPLSAVTGYENSGVDPIVFGGRLKVEAVLDGSLLAADGRLRVNLRLLRTSDGSQIWSGAFDEPETEIFKLQDALSMQVANALVAELSSDDRRRLSARATENLEAYKLYARGRFLWNQRSVESYYKAIEAFQEAIALDPNFAAGYSGIADSYSLLEQRGGLSPHEAFPKAEAAAQKALDLDRSLAEAHVSMALVKSLYRWDWRLAEDHLKRAIELDPYYASAYGLYGMNILSAKRFDEAAEHLAKAERLDPTSRSIGIYIAWKYYFERDFDRAIEQCRKVLELDSSVTTPYTILRSAYEQKGLHKEAVEAELARLRNLQPGTSEQLNEAFMTGGIEAFWEKQIEVIRSGKGSKTEVADYILASRLALLGRKEESLAEIEKGFATRGSMWHQITVEPAFDTLRGLPTFQRLEQAVGHAE